MPEFRDLMELLQGMGSVAVAYSGGVDSTLLARVATDALGDRVVGVLARSALMPAAQIEQAIKFAQENCLNLHIIDADPLAVPEVAANAADRCYHCKKAVFGLVSEFARQRGLLWVLDGTNVDDISDYRPGEKAAEELGVRSPLKELGFTKSDIRRVSRELGLRTWDKPSAACLASRVPYGTALDAAVLERVERAEAALERLGFRGFRVRHHGDLARIEVRPDDTDRFRGEDTRNDVVTALSDAGYTYVALDLEGYRTGSMNKALG